MIIFLTLCYCAVLALFVKLKLIRLNLAWKLSPIIWMVFLLVVLFFPMQWGAPAGSINVYQYVIEIIPNVSGEVIEVSAVPFKPVKKGDVLFRLDPKPFQIEVRRLEALLAEAEHLVPQLKAALDEARATTKVAEARLDFSLNDFDRTKKLREKGAVTLAEFEAAQRTLDSVKASLDQYKANEEQARLAYASEINGVNTTVAKTRQMLAKAKLNLEYATVRAPMDGYVIALSLRPGQRVTNLPIRSWMAFVVHNQSRLAVWVDQYVLRNIQPGQHAEVAFKLYPGQTFSATVEKVAPIAEHGQLQPSGIIPAAPDSESPDEFAVILNLEPDQQFSTNDLSGGAGGSAVIYTDSAKATHIIRKVMIRMDSWLNYIIPW